MSTYTQETQYKLRELNRVASPAPWRYVGDCDYMKAGVKLGDIVDAGGRVVVPESPYVLGGPFEREFIIQTRNALPVLLAEIERLTEENQTLKRENHLAWSKGHAAGWDCHIITMQAADLLPKDQKTSNPYEENRK